MLQLPLQSKVLERYTETFSADSALKKDNFITFNHHAKLKKNALRHSLFFSGCDLLRQMESESVGDFTNHITGQIQSSAQKTRMFERGFYASYRGNIEPLPVPFPRMFSKGRLNEMSMMKE